MSDTLKELFMNPEKYGRIPFPGTEYDHYFFSVDPATGDQKLYLQIDKNSPAIPIPDHLLNDDARRKAKFEAYNAEIKSWQPDQVYSELERQAVLVHYRKPKRDNPWKRFWKELFGKMLSRITGWFRD